MLTLFAVPRAFAGDTAVRQRNALESWIRLHAKCDILLFGDEEGIAETAAEFGVFHVPDVIRNSYGTPLLDTVFDHVIEFSAHRQVCYLNADIVLTGDFIEAARRVRFRDFLLSGRRWDLDASERLEFDAGWEHRIRSRVKREGVAATTASADYFLFSPPTLYENMPPFAVGRPGWDNWMFYRARIASVPIIDATTAITAIHFTHGYEHVPEPRDHRWRGPEGDENIWLTGSVGAQFGHYDASHRMSRKLLTPNLAPRALYRRWKHGRLVRRARPPERRASG